MPLAETSSPLFNKGKQLWTFCPVLPRPCVRISIPGFLFDTQSCLGQYGAEPAGDVHPDVVNLVSVLPAAPGAIHVGPVLQDLHSAAFPTCLLSALFLKEKCITNTSQKCSFPRALYTDRALKARGHWGWFLGLLLSKAEL